MTSEITPPPSRPKFIWPKSGWALTALGTAIAVLLLVFPSATNLSLFARMFIVTGLILIPALTIGLLQSCKLVFYVLAKARHLDVVLLDVVELSKERDRLLDAIAELLRERGEARAFRIDYCYSFQKQAIIALKRKKGLTAATDDVVTVIDPSTGQVFGKFIVFDDKNDRYLARGISDLDPLWLGYIVQAGTTHSEAPPTAIAILWNSKGDR